MIYSADTFPYDIFTKARICPPPREMRWKSRKAIVDVVCAFDIETTRIKEIEQSVMYVWQFQAGKEHTCIGRSWKEFSRFLARARKACGQSVLVIYVHNLSYEFQFLSGIWDFDPKDVFAIERRKVLCARLPGIEFRCSYLHCNMSLDQYTRKMGVEVPKIRGFDYDKPRFPWTPLAEDEIAYCVTDVKALVEAIDTEMRMDGDTLQTIPLTSTGYVRRECEKGMRGWWKQAVKDQRPSIDLWKICREAFRGGDTHANRYYSGYTLKDVHSYDRSSSYPDVICNCEFPMSPFTQEQKPSVESLMTYMGKHKRPCIFRAWFWGVSLLDVMNGAPYLSIDKCLVKDDYINDNGRILSAKCICVSLTDIDFRIICKEYKWQSMEVEELWISKYGKLPQPIRDLCLKYYRDKTIMKGDESRAVEYEKIKNKFNAIYGMMAQNPVRRSVIYDPKGGFAYDTVTANETILDKYNSTSYLMYQWGVWVTAWARYRLREAIWLVGAGFVYTDTDSVKYMGEVDWTELNAKLQAASEASGAYAKDSEGELHYMGVYELDAEYNTFRTMGAKKYAYTKNGELKITIAGVDKHKGAEELGTIENMVEGFVFLEAGGLESVYNDNPPMDYYIVDGHKIDITRNVVLRPSTYKLGITAEYERILFESRGIFEKLRNKY